MNNLKRKFELSEDDFMQLSNNTKLHLLWEKGEVIYGPIEKHKAIITLFIIFSLVIETVQNFINEEVQISVVRRSSDLEKISENLVLLNHKVYVNNTIV